MGQYLEKVSSITDYEDQDDNIIVGFGETEMKEIKKCFAQISDMDQNPQLLKESELRDKLSQDDQDEARRVIKYIFDFDQTGKVDYYKFVCGLSMINSATLEVKAEILWKIYNKNENNEYLSEDDLKLFLKTVLKVTQRTEYDENVRDAEYYRIVKRFGKEYEREDKKKTKALNINKWKELIANDSLIIKFLLKFGMISKFGGGTEIPEVDSDLEEEIQKGYQGEDFERIERIKNGIEHSEQKKDGDQQDEIDPEEAERLKRIENMNEEQKEEYARKQDLEQFPWKEVSQKLQPASFKPFEGENNPPTALLQMEHVYGYRCHDTRNSLKIGREEVVHPDTQKKEPVLLYHTASIGIVQFFQTKGQCYQKFFMEHTDDISCLDIRKNYCVTGQLGSKPLICVWDYTKETLESEHVLSGVLTEGIAKVCISRVIDKNFLIGAVALDDLHTIAIYDMNKVNEAREKLITDPEYGIVAKGTNTRSPCWDLKFTYDDKYLICAGQGEVGFFTFYNKELKKTKAIWDPKMAPQSALCIGLLKSYDDGEQESRGGLIATGMYKGQICLWKNGKQVATIRAHQNACTSMITRRDTKGGERVNGIITGGNDGEIKSWYLTYNATTKEYGLKIDQEYSLYDEEFEKGLDLQNPKINAVFQSQNGILICGTRGSQIIEIKPRKEVLVHGHFEGDLKGLVVHPKKDKFYTVGEDLLLARWNMGKYDREDGQIIESPANAIDITHDGKYLAVGSVKGDLNIYKEEDFTKPFKQRNDNLNGVHCMKFSPNSQYLAVSYSKKLVLYKCDNNFGVFENNEGYIPLIEFDPYEKHSFDYVTHMDFSEDGQMIRTNTVSMKIIVYETRGEQYSNFNALRDVKWASQSCILSWETQGIWPACSLGTDINAVDATSNRQIIAVGDDFSKIKLFRNPCRLKNAAFNRYSGHAAAITNLKFSYDDNRLLSVGGNEKSIIQWRFFFDSESQAAFDEANKQLKQKDEAERAAAAAAGDDDDLFGEEEVEKGDEAGAMKPFKGNIKPPGDFKMNVKKYNKKPKNNLSLHWAHGFRTQYIEKIDETRNMCKFIEGGRVAYATAALGIVYDIKNKEQTFFQKHEEDIISMAIHPQKKIVATGQMAQKGKAKAIDIFIWDIDTKEVKGHFNSFHLRAIIYLDFSPDGTKLLSVGQDDDNSFAIFDWMSSRMVANGKVDKAKVNVLLWKNDTEFVTAGARHIKFWTMKGKNCSSENGRTGGGSFVAQTAGIFHPGSKKVLTGGAEGSIFIWNGKSGDNIAKNAHGDKNKVGSMVNLPSGNILTGGYDGKVIEWSLSGSKISQVKVVVDCKDLTTFQYKKFGPGGVVSLDVHEGKLLVGTLTAEVFVGEENGANMQPIVQGHFSGETWGACTAPNDDKFCSSGGDNTVRLWDITQKKQICATPPFPNDIRAIDWSKNGKFIAIADFKAHLYTLNPTNLQQICGPVKTAYAGQKTSAKSYFWIEEIKISPCSQYVAVGFHGTSAKSYIEIFKADGDGSLKPAFKFNSTFSSAILHLDWSEDSENIIGNSQAYELKTFGIQGNKGQQVNMIHNMEFGSNPFWSTFTCKFGWAVQGIWQGVDYSDINTVCRSNNHKILCTGGDDGRVNMFNYPVVVDKQVHKSYIGHSSHVTRVRFTIDDNWLVSTGGNDRSVLLWSTGGIGGEMVQGDDGPAASAIKSGAAAEEDDEDDDEDCAGPSKKKKKEKQKKEKKVNKKQDGDEFEEEAVDKGDEFAACKPWIGAIKAPSDFDNKGYNKSGKSKAPKVALHKEYVWGYRCKDTRNNIRYIVNDDKLLVVYHAAAVGIVLDPETNTQSFFNGHIDDITAMDVHPDQKTVVTGEVGPKPNIFVWDAVNRNVICNIKKPLQKGIANLQFSPSGKYFAAMAIDVDHQVAVFDLEGNTIAFCDKNPDEKLEISWMGEDQFATCGPKGLQIWECEKGKPLSGKKKQGASKASSKYTSVATFGGKYYVGGVDGVVQAIGGKSEKIHKASCQMIQDCDSVLLTGGNDGRLCGVNESLDVQWSIQFGNRSDEHLLKQQEKNKGNELEIDIEIEISHHLAKGLRSAAFDNDKNPTRLIVGLYCSEIYEFINFNPKSKKHNVRRIMTGHFTPAQTWLNEVWGLDIFKDPKQGDSFVTCADDCTLRKYSISDRKQTAIAETIYDSKKRVTKPDPKTKDPNESTIARAVGLNTKGTWAVVGMKEGTCMRFKVSDKGFSHYSTFKHATRWVQDIKFNADDSTLCYGAHDRGIYGYNSKGDKGWKLWKKKLVKHSSYITHIDFSTDGTVLHSNCGAYELLFWDLDNLKQNPSGASAYKDEEWQTWTATLGWPVQGIWPECADGTDINGVDRSHNKKLLATSDDFGTVNVFNYPCINKGSKCKQGKGHSSHVTNVKWTQDDKRLITTGGEDQCVILWKVVHGGKDEEDFSPSEE